MNKETFLFNLSAIKRQIACMSQSTFEEIFKDDEIKFVRQMFTERSKIETIITMKKTEIEE